MVIVLSWVTYRLDKARLKLSEKVHEQDARINEVLYKITRGRKSDTTKPQKKVFLGKDLRYVEPKQTEFIGWGLNSKPIEETFCVSCRRKYPSTRIACPYCGTSRQEVVPPGDATLFANTTQPEKPAKIQAMEKENNHLFELLSQTPRFRAIITGGSGNGLDLHIHAALKEMGLENGVPESGISYDYLFDSMKSLVTVRMNPSTDGKV